MRKLTVTVVLVLALGLYIGAFTALAELGQPSYSFDDGNTWASGSRVDLLITVYRDFSLFSHVLVNGDSLISGEHYEAWSASTEIAIYWYFLETLPGGQHTLDVRFTDGVNLRTHFHTVVPGAAATDPEPEADPEPEPLSPAAETEPPVVDAEEPPVAEVGPPAPSGEGGFIGTPHVQDDGVPSSPTAVSDFGTVPQTGVPGVSLALIIMGVSILASALLLAYIFSITRVKQKRKPAGPRS
ncbi:MAG: hypothetical protein FWB97_08735 [Oscillospiraceae bacterium]|nr:hypothetical protein [Oscillospiraceae bacterium]